MVSFPNVQHLSLMCNKYALLFPYVQYLAFLVQPPRPHPPSPPPHTPSWIPFGVYGSIYTVRFTLFTQYRLGPVRTRRYEPNTSPRCWSQRWQFWHERGRLATRVRRPLCWALPVKKMCHVLSSSSLLSCGITVLARTLSYYCRDVACQLELYCWVFGRQKLLKVFVLCFDLKVQCFVAFVFRWVFFCSSSS